jgi:hypothetical protein
MACVSPRLFVGELSGHELKSGDHGYRLASSFTMRSNVSRTPHGAVSIVRQVLRFVSGFPRVEVRCVAPPDTQHRHEVHPGVRVTGPN